MEKIKKILTWLIVFLPRLIHVLSLLIQILDLFVLKQTGKFLRFCNLLKPSYDTHADHRDII